MKSWMILTGLGGVLLCGVVVWTALGRANPPAPVPVSTAEPRSGAASVDHRGAPPVAKVQAEPATPSAPAKPAPPPAEPRLGGPTPRAAEFLPYPNAGESDFKLKYQGLDLAALTKDRQSLQELLNDEFKRLSDERFAAGLFEERIFDPRNPSAEVKEAKPPEGMGQVRPAQQTEAQPDGTLKNKTAWITESEQPEFFAHQSEFNFVSNAWKQAGGH